MSEQQNTALIQEIYAAFSRGDIAGILSRVTDDVQWTTEGPPVIPYAGKMVGRDQVQKFFSALSSTQENMKLTTDGIIAQGDQVATHGRYSGVVKATGKRFDGPIAHIFTIRDGKVSRFLDIIDTAQMVDAYTAPAAAGAHS